MKGQETVNVAVQVKAVDTKKNNESLPTKAVQAQPKIGVFDFVGSIKDEIKKISWTSPEELKTYTRIVVGVTFFLGMGIYGLDLIIHGALNILSYLFHFIA